MPASGQAPSAAGGLLLIALAAISWGTTGAVTTILVERAGASPLLIGAARMWVAALFLVAGTRLAGHRLGLSRGDAWRAVGLGGCMAAYQVTYFTAVTLAGITVAALVAICSAPLLIAGLAATTLREPLSRRVLLALGVGVVGTALLIATPRGALDFSRRGMAGALLALAAGLAYALYVVITKRALVGSAPLPLASATFAFAAVLLTPVFAWVEGPVRQIALGWPWLVYLGAVATAAAYAIYTVGLRRVPAGVAGIATLLEPLTATLLGTLVFGERLGGLGVLGAALLLGALLLVLTDRAS